MPAFTHLLASEYQRLFDSCTIQKDRVVEVDARMKEKMGWITFKFISFEQTIGRVKRHSETVP